MIDHACDAVLGGGGYGSYGSTDTGISRRTYAAVILRANLDAHWSARLPQLLEEAVADSMDGCTDFWLLYPEERAELARDVLIEAASSLGCSPGRNGAAAK